MMQLQQKLWNRSAGEAGKFFCEALHSPLLTSQLLCSDWLFQWSFALCALRHLWNTGGGKLCMAASRFHQFIRRGWTVFVVCFKLL
jgi:hypothetical protein